MAAAEFQVSAGTVRAASASGNGLGKVIADVAVLVADGASPTQAHVTTLNTHLTAMLAQGDITLYIANIANVGDMNVLRHCLRELETIIQGSGILSIGSGNPRPR